MKRNKEKTLKKSAKQDFIEEDSQGNLWASFESFNPDPINSVSIASDVRRNRSSTVERTDKYANIENSLTPFSNSSEYGDSAYDVKDAVRLCQQAYWNFPIFTNTIELMTEFSISEIFLKGKNEKSKEFFNALFNRINLWSLQEQYFREYYRSGNIFIVRHDVNLTSADLRAMTQAFGSISNSNASLPLKYEILNPVDVKYNGGVSYFSGTYHQVLTDYQVAALRDRKTEDDARIFNSLPKEVKEQINSGTTSVMIPLDPKKISCSFYKKQDYEPFAVPMGFGVLGDLNWKEELKKMDMALARTIQQVVLLVTTGAEKDKGGIDPKRIAELKSIFANESVGRVLIADYTTKAEFVIPQIADILDPEKYQVVNEDIRIGLHNILVGNEKFSNQSSKVNLFLEKLRCARKSFLNNFLIPEIKRISQIMGFKNYPTPHFEEYDLKDEVEYARIYTRLYEVGVLTPDETIRAINTGILPDPEDSLNSQNDLSKLRKKEQYLPITYFQKDKPEAAGMNGRPPGAKRKQSTKKVKPLSASAIVDTIKKMDSIEKSIASKLYPNKVMTPKDHDDVSRCAHGVFTASEMNEWDSIVNASESLKEIESNSAITFAINDIAKEHQIDTNAATILYHSREK